VSVWPSLPDALDKKWYYMTRRFGRTPMKLSGLFLIIVLAALATIIAFYHEQLWLYVSTLYCLLRYESVGCT
jgi:hypothetical protein